MYIRPLLADYPRFLLLKLKNHGKCGNKAMALELNTNENLEGKVYSTHTAKGGMWRCPFAPSYVFHDGGFKKIK